MYCSVLQCMTTSVLIHCQKQYSLLSVSHCPKYCISSIRRLLFLLLLVLCGYYSRAVFISLESLEKSTMTVVSHRNDSYNTNSPDTSVVTVNCQIINHLHTCAHAVFTIATATI